VSSELAVDSRGDLTLLSFLPKPIREPRRPTLALVVAWLTALVPSIALAAIIGRIAPEAVQPQFDVRGLLAVFLLAVFSPVVETLIMGSVLLVLLRFLKPSVAVIASSIGWGLVHSSIAPTWGLVIWWPFLIFSTLFVTWREKSLLAAFAMPAIVHAMQNLPTALVVAYGKPF
jgi:Type II CAAX prenyl endopeptidase Rce1-like